RLPPSFYLGFTLTESARQVLGTDLNRSEIGPFKQIKRIADRYPDATIEPTSAKDRVWHEADFQNGGVRAVGCSRSQSDLRKRPLGFGSLSLPPPPAWLKFRNADEHAPRQCRKRQGAIVAVVVAFLRLAPASWILSLSHALPRPPAGFSQLDGC